jgi:hypothetical protein
MSICDIMLFHRDNFTHYVSFNPLKYIGSICDAWSNIRIYDYGPQLLLIFSYKSRNEKLSFF